jgi:hypothetical protein
MTDKLWTVAEEIASRIRAAPEVVQFARAFDHSQDDLAGRLSELTSRYSPLRASPILIGVRLQKTPIVEELIVSPEDEDWFDVAVRVGTSFLIFIELMRSRLPGYPVLRVPHRRRGSPYLLETDTVIVHHFPWERELNQLGLQLKGATEFNSLFGADPGIGDALESLLSELAVRPSWKRFAQAAGTLSPSDREELTALGKRYAEMVRDEEVDRLAGDGLFARFEYRMAVLEEVVADSSGLSLEYLRSFEEVDQLITVVASFIQRLIIDTSLETLVPARFDLGDAPELIPVDLLVPSLGGFIEPGEVALVEPPRGQAGLVLPQKINFSLQDLSGGRPLEAQLVGYFVPLDSA